VQAAVAEALKGARAVIVTGKLGPHLLPLATAAGVEHIVLPSLAGENGAHQTFVGSQMNMTMHARPMQSQRIHMPYKCLYQVSASAIQAGSRAPLLSWAQMRRCQTPSRKLRWRPAEYRTPSCAQVRGLLFQCCTVQHCSTAALQHCCAPLVQPKVMQKHVWSCMLE
jgi:hypothetical protein